MALGRKLLANSGDPIQEVAAGPMCSALGRKLQLGGRHGWSPVDGLECLARVKNVTKKSVEIIWKIYFLSIVQLYFGILFLSQITHNWTDCVTQSTFWS